MKLSELKGLSPRARAALERFGITTVEAAQDLSREELLAFKGVGESSVELILSEQPYQEAFAEGSEIEEAVRDEGFDPGPSIADQVKAHHGEEGQPAPSQASIWGIARRDQRQTRADAFFRLLCEHKAPSQELIKIAWDLALAFEQEGRRAGGAALELHDGLEVRLDGRNYTVRTSWKAGEEPPKEYARLALVPVER